jgi:hypothetical protein
MESSPRPMPPGSFGETAGAACDVARASKARMRWAVALLVVGVVVAFAPGLAADMAFLRVVHIWHVDGRGEWIELVGLTRFDRTRVDGSELGTSALDLVRTEVAWAAIAASLGVVSLLFGWWRRDGFPFARWAGVGCSMAAAVSVIALVASMRGLSDVPSGNWWTVPLGGALMAAAFVVAPAPRVRDE